MRGGGSEGTGCEGRLLYRERGALKGGLEGSCLCAAWPEEPCPYPGLCWGRPLGAPARLTPSVLARGGLPAAPLFCQGAGDCPLQLPELFFPCPHRALKTIGSAES